MAKLAGNFFKRVSSILDQENIQYDKAVVAEVIKKHFPDWRRVLNELQRYSATGKIDSGILSNLQETSIKELVDLLKDRNFTEVRKWIMQNTDQDQNHIFRKFYDTSKDYFKKESIPELVLLISQYQYQAAFAADPEINLAAFFVKVMTDCEFL
jgi:DNA polymerase III delta prime subunit